MKTTLLIISFYFVGIIPTALCYLIGIKKENFKHDTLIKKICLPFAFFLALLIWPIMVVAVLLDYYDRLFSL